MEGQQLSENTEGVMKVECSNESKNQQIVKDRTTRIMTNIITTVKKFRVLPL